MSDEGRETESFGLYATTGRVATFLAPLGWTLAIRWGHDQYWGVLGIVAVLLVGLVLFLLVRFPAGLRVDARELLVSTVAEAAPDMRETSADPSIWPLFAAAAVGATFVYSIFTPWAVVWGAAPIAITLIGWFWPKGTPEDES